MTNLPNRMIALRVLQPPPGNGDGRTWRGVVGNEVIARSVPALGRAEPGLPDQPSILVVGVYGRLGVIDADELVGVLAGLSRS